MKEKEMIQALTPITKYTVAALRSLKPSSIAQEYKRSE